MIVERTDRNLDSLLSMQSRFFTYLLGISWSLFVVTCQQVVRGVSMSCNKEGSTPKRLHAEDMSQRENCLGRLLVRSKEAPSPRSQTLTAL
jgi:hypothetical protein